MKKKASKKTASRGKTGGGSKKVTKKAVSTVKTVDAADKGGKAGRKTATKSSAPKVLPAKKGGANKGRKRMTNAEREKIEADAKAGKLPPVPDFSAETHKRFRGALDEVVKMARAKDVKGLKAFKIKPISTSPRAIDRYRKLAITALSAR